ncbi:hypothetical protein GDO86_014106 [Hymenochirus boettgeri]|uniref:Coiled-coil domain-containing protein 40 n=1 Tax=Hymenochirus boettgeri TaxID=247094 RepID=A0A8T2JQF9_9PIPI|nr:hypothetical protein GDO86_014106 [Hymenochirus boettgeri]
MGLEKQHDKHNQVSALAIKEKELEAIRKIGRESGLRLSYMENANEDLRSDVTVMKRAVQKVEKDKRQAEVEKQKQDMFVGRLTRELDRLREQIALYEAQVSAQREDTKAAREAISEVGSPHGIDAIGVEKKQLLQAVEQHLIVWPSGALSMETEIEGYNKAIRKEEDKNEQLTFMLNRAESDTAMSKKLVAQCLARQEALRVEYSTYVCTLQETEQALNRVTVERAGYLNEITAIQKQIEKESHLKLNLETQILAKLKEKMTSDKAAKYSSLLAAKLQKQKLELEAEKESIEMQENLRHLEEEKERLLLNLVEAEQQNMLWEKKIQLAKEMRNAVDSEMGQGEIQAMKAEIHRMQLRYNQLMKQQEKMIKDLEATVTRRETITWRAQGQSEKNKKQLTVSDLRRKKQELRKKIKEIQKNTEECDGTIADLENTRKSLTSTIAEKQHNVSTMKENVSSMEAEVEQLQEKKRLNLTQIVSYQTRVKHLQAVKDGKYKPICSSLEALKAEEQKQESRIHTISTIIHQIQQEYPQYQSDLRCISLALEAHAGHQNEHTINKQ